MRTLRGLKEISDRCEQRLLSLSQMSDSRVAKLLKRLHLPPNAPLPSTADVERYHDLFLCSSARCAGDASRGGRRPVEPARKERHAIGVVGHARETQPNVPLSRGPCGVPGGSSIFSIYRYKVAAKPVELPPWPTFCERAQNVLTAKAEVDKELEYRRSTGGFTGRFEMYEYDIDALPNHVEPVDYIFTDPPYGGHISYIDLSTLWNTWNVGRQGYRSGSES